jgi:hypothetical protein
VPEQYIGRGVLAEPGDGHDAVADLQTHLVVDSITIAPLDRMPGQPGPIQVPTTPDSAGPSETSPDI